MIHNTILDLVSRETYNNLSLYVDTLIKWQYKINLISKNTIDDIWTRHILDALQLLPLIPEKSANTIDIGSGAGIPGLILAIAGHANMTLIESDKRKCAFLMECARLCKVNVSIINQRIEDIIPFPADYILSRACADIQQLLHYSYPFYYKKTVCLFPKGENYAKEIGDASIQWNFGYELIQSSSDSRGKIIKMYTISKT
jgi:16S rRNA (guanine527-N7)-methyltransferase